MELNDDEEAFDLTLPAVDDSCSLGESRLSPAPFDDPRSEALPEVFGVFADDPKEAKAPEPRPKAFEAPAEGDETPAERGEIAVKGLERAWELSGPKRFDEWLRGRSSLAPPSLSLPDTESDSLLELAPPLVLVADFRAEKDTILRRLCLLRSPGPQIRVIHRGSGFDSSETERSSDFHRAIQRTKEAVVKGTIDNQ